MTKTSNMTEPSVEESPSDPNSDLLIIFNRHKAILQTTVDQFHQSLIPSNISATFEEFGKQIDGCLLKFDQVLSGIIVSQSPNGSIDDVSRLKLSIALDALSISLHEGLKETEVSCRDLIECQEVLSRKAAPWEIRFANLVKDMREGEVRREELEARVHRLGTGVAGIVELAKEMKARDPPPPYQSN